MVPALISPPLSKTERALRSVALEPLALAQIFWPVVNEVVTSAELLVPCNQMLPVLLVRFWLISTPPPMTEMLPATVVALSRYTRLALVVLALPTVMLAGV